ncbi:MAG: class I SAM-dependent methyltransferase [Elusimicrobia bacterium]|nr:class I SAM-dependent methyltransferase [Elusimicrobiota bacterium]
MEGDSCPLCGESSRLFLRDGGRDYRRCARCALTFVPAAQHAEPERERARYAEHRNGPGDAGYRAFLDRLLAPLAARLPAGAQGLDYGCGPGPAASVMLRERGFSARDYDPFFAPDPAALTRTYDFIVCTEVFEHLRRPAEDLARLDGLLRPGAVLGVMTGVLENDADFAGWWYRADFTHIAFYRPQTLAWIARRFGWRLVRPSRDTAIYLKANAA